MLQNILSGECAEALLETAMVEEDLERARRNAREVEWDIDVCDPRGRRLASAFHSTVRHAEEDTLYVVATGIAHLAQLYRACVYKNLAPAITVPYSVSPKHNVSNSLVFFAQEQIKRRLASQFNTQKKKQTIEKAIKKDNHGKLWILDNSREKSLDKLFNDIINYIK